jgi:hypothetical protein
VVSRSMRFVSRSGLQFLPASASASLFRADHHPSFFAGRALAARLPRRPSIHSRLIEKVLKIIVSWVKIESIFLPP